MRTVRKIEHRFILDRIFFQRMREARALIALTCWIRLRRIQQVAYNDHCDHPAILRCVCLVYVLNAYQNQNSLPVLLNVLCFSVVKKNNSMTGVFTWTIFTLKNNQYTLKLADWSKTWQHLPTSLSILFLGQLGHVFPNQLRKLLEMWEALQYDGKPKSTICFFRTPSLTTPPPLSESLHQKPFWSSAHGGL